MEPGDILNMLIVKFGVHFQDRTDLIFKVQSVDNKKNHFLLTLVHWSLFQHQHTPMSETMFVKGWEL